MCWPRCRAGITGVSGVVSQANWLNQSHGVGQMSPCNEEGLVRCWVGLRRLIIRGGQEDLKRGWWGEQGIECHILGRFLVQI